MLLRPIGWERLHVDASMWHALWNLQGSLSVLDVLQAAGPCMCECMASQPIHCILRSHVRCCIKSSCLTCASTFRQPCSVALYSGSPTTQPAAMALLCNVFGHGTSMHSQLTAQCMTWRAAGL